MPPTIHNKEILKTTPFCFLILGHKSSSINDKTLKDTQQTTKVFPFGMTTQCNEQIASHSTNYPKQYILFEGLTPSLPVRKVLPSAMSRQRHIPPPTLSSTFFQKTQFNQFFLWRVSLTDVDHDSQAWNPDINPYWTLAQSKVILFSFYMDFPMATPMRAHS